MRNNPIFYMGYMPHAITRVRGEQVPERRPIWVIHPIRRWLTNRIDRPSSKVVKCDQQEKWGLSVIVIGAVILSERPTNQIRIFSDANKKNPRI
jgi:hypothetical protein